MKHHILNFSLFFIFLIPITAQDSLEDWVFKGIEYHEMGQYDKAIEVLEKATKKYPESHLVFYNLGINYAKIAKYKASVKAFEKAIINEPKHTSSHLTLAQIQLRLGKKSKAALSYYYFLLLEPDSPRSNIAFDNLSALMNPPKNNSGGIDIALVLDENDDNAWTMRDLMISTVGMAKDEVEEKSEAEKFVKNTQTIFSIFKEGMEEKIISEGKMDIYDSLYIPMINQVLSADAVETFAYYASQRQGEEQRKWLKDHEEDVDKLLNLFK